METIHAQAQRRTQYGCILFGALLVLLHNQFLGLISSTVLFDGLFSCLSWVPAWAGYMLLIKVTTALLPGWRHVVADMLMGLAAVSDILGIVWMCMNAYPPRLFTWFGLLGQITALLVLAAWVRREREACPADDTKWKPAFLILIVFDAFVLIYDVIYMCCAADGHVDLFRLPYYLEQVILLLRLLPAVWILWSLHQFQLRLAMEGGHGDRV